jgi:hypothetical protein
MPRTQKKRPARAPRKEASPHHANEEFGTAFDPTTQHLDLSKDEKRRTTALLMAIQAYDHLIIKDAEMYIAINREYGRDDDGPMIKPATIEAMVMAAMQFDAFISGDLETAEANQSQDLNRATPAEQEAVG